MRMPKANIKTVTTEYSVELEDTQKVQLATILGRSLTEEESEITVTLTGYPVPYSPATRWQPEEGGYLEDITPTYEDKDVSILFNEEDSNWTKFEEKLKDAWGDAVQSFKDDWDSHLASEAEYRSEENLLNRDNRHQD